MDDRLFRSRDDRMLAGVAGGLAELWDVDPSLIRIIWAVLVPFTGGIALLVYIVMAVVVPEEPSGAFLPFGAMPPVEPGATTPPSPAQSAGPTGSGWTMPDGSRQEARAARMEAHREQHARAPEHAPERDVRHRPHAGAGEERHGLRGRGVVVQVARRA